MTSIMSAYEPISYDEIYHRAPAIFAEKAHDSRKDSYAFVSTKELLEGMGEHKFFPFAVHQSSTRDATKVGFTKHAICFRHESTFDIAKENDIVPQVVILNSHDGTTSYKIYCGFFRFVCSNGIIVGNTIDMFSVYHRGSKNTMDMILDASYSILDNSIKMMEVIDEWKATELTYEQKMELAYQAHELKFGNKNTPIRPEQFLEARNYEDGYNNTSLWNVFNTIQENMIKGGLEGWKDGTRQRKHERLKVRTRSINNVSQNIKMNTELWNIAQNMYNSII